MSILNNNSKLNFRLRDIIRAAFGIAMVDGGFIIAIQIITFLLNYFGTNLQISDPDNAFAGFTKTHFLIAILSMLNLSVIIYRVAGLARGVKYNLAVCYQHALRRWPVLILLYMLGSILLLLVAMPLAGMLKNTNIIMFCMLAFIPYGILACIFVIDQENSPLAAIQSTFKIIKEKVSIRLLLNISTLYALPFVISTILVSSYVTPYLGLFNAVWFLFCHILIVVIYVSTHVPIQTDNSREKPTKVIIV